MNHFFEGEVETPEEQEPAKEEKEKKDQRIRRIRIILLAVGKKLIKNPNTHATLAGIIWAIIHFR